jgi:hypothetical protein
LPNHDILPSNVLSKPEINVPIMVTDNTPIIMPNAVSIDLVLFAKIAESDIMKFSIKSKNITV